jgi:hypothetical protein
MEKIEQTKVQGSKTTKKKWESLYLLKILVVRENCGWVDRHKGN